MRNTIQNECGTQNRLAFNMSANISLKVLKMCKAYL